MSNLIVPVLAMAGGPSMTLQASLERFDDLGIEQDKIAFDDFGS